MNENDFLSPSYNYQNILDSINELKRIEKQSIDGNYLLDLLTYDGISMWWFFYPRLSQKFLKYIAFIINFSKFIDEFKPRIVYVVDELSYFNIIKQVCHQKNIKLKVSNWNHFKYRVSTKIVQQLRNYNARRITKRKIHSSPRGRGGCGGTSPAMMRSVQSA